MLRKEAFAFGIDDDYDDYKLQRRDYFEFLDIADTCRTYNDSRRNTDVWALPGQSTALLHLPHAQATASAAYRTRGKSIKRFSLRRELANIGFGMRCFAFASRADCGVWLLPR